MPGPEPGFDNCFIQFQYPAAINGRDFHSSETGAVKLQRISGFQVGRNLVQGYHDRLGSF